MFARVTRHAIPLDMLDADVQLTAEIARTTIAVPGCVGYFYFMDYQGGRTLGVTLWEGDEAMRHAETVVSENLARRIMRSAAREVSRESYEVVAAISKLPEPTTL